MPKRGILPIILLAGLLFCMPAFAWGGNSAFTPQTSNNGLDKGTADDWFDKGYELYEQGKYEDAIHAFDEAIKINPLRGAWNNKGLALFDLEKYEEAVKAYDQALKIDPQSAEIWCNKGTALSAMGKLNESIDALDHATTIDPQNPVVWFTKGIILYAHAKESLSKKDDDSSYAIMDLLDATSCFDKSLELNSNDSIACIAWYKKGNILTIFGRNNEAIDAYDEALKIDPTNSEIQEQKNSVLMTLGPRLPSSVFQNAYT